MEQPRPTPDDETHALDPATLERLVAEYGAAPAAPAGGWRVGSYRLMTEIGRGSMGLVYLARHERLEREVALKILPSWLSLDEHARQRFLLEARAMARVSHPSVVPIHDVVEDGGTLAIAMERVRGRTLADVVGALRDHAETAAPTLDDIATALGTTRDRIAQRDYASWVAAVGGQLAAALQAVHDAGLTHRDVKPSNVLIDEEGRAHLTDFGVVREIEATLTRTSGFVGTAPYAAPEQLRGDAAIDARADVYGLGATLYELLTLAAPVDGTPATILATISRGAVTPLARRAVVAHPPSLALVVHHAIEPERDRRYATAAQLAADLAAVSQSRPISVRPLTGLERVALWARREPARARLAAVVGLATVSVVVFGGYLWSQWPRIREAQRLELERRVDDLLDTGRTLQVRLSDQADSGSLLRHALALAPDSPIALGLLALQVAHADGAPAALAVLDDHPAIVDASPALRDLRELGVELYRHSPAGGVEALRHAEDPLQCFFAGVAIAARAREFVDPDRLRTRLRDAVPLLQRAILMSDPVPRILRTELATIAAEAGDERAARDQLRVLEPGWTGDPSDDSPATALRAIEALVALGDFEAALAICATPAFARATPSAAAVLHARALRRSGALDAAIGFLEAAIAAESEPLMDPRHTLMQTLAERGADGDRERVAELRAELLSMLDGFIAATPARSGSWARAQLSRIELRSEADAGDAATALRELIEAVPEAWLLQHELASQLNERSNRLVFSLHRSIQRYIQRIARSSSVPPERDAVGRRLMQDPGFAGAHTELHELLDETLERLGRVREAVPYHPRFAKNLVRWYVRFGPDDPDALPSIDRYTAMDPGNPEVEMLRGWLLYRQRRFGDAEPALANAWAALPDHPAAHGLLGWCRWELGQEGAAREAFEAALEAASRRVARYELEAAKWTGLAQLGLALLDLGDAPTPEQIATARSSVKSARASCGDAPLPYLFGVDEAVLAACAVAEGEVREARQHLVTARRGRDLASLLPIGDLDFAMAVSTASTLIERLEERTR